MPFVTEEIWGALRESPVSSATDEEPMLVRAAWPAVGARAGDAEEAFERLAALVRGVRNLRTEAGTPAGAWVPLVVEPSDERAERELGSAGAYLGTLARVRPIELRGAGDRPELVAASPLGAAWLAVDAAGQSAAAERRAAQIEEIDRNIARVRTLLANDAFVDRAPEAVVERERRRLVDLEQERQQLEGAR
jgi:valyl-tRNA synthetase